MLEPSRCYHTANDGITSGHCQIPYGLCVDTARDPINMHANGSHVTFFARTVHVTIRYRVSCRSISLRVWALADWVQLQVGIMHTSRNSPTTAEAFEPLINAHGRDIVEAVITGAALASPRSMIPNFAEILVAVIVRTPTSAKSWIEDLMNIVSRV
jgi:hypothetical protein